MLDKTELLKSIVLELKEARDKAAQAADSAKETATNKENVAENRYDTLGLEAAYLAHGQSDRILQLEEALRLFEQMEISQTPEVTMGSLVELENERGENSFVFVGPSSGGLKVTCGNLPIQVITPVAPLGQMLMGAQVGDEVTLGIGKQTRTFLVVAVY